MAGLNRSRGAGGVVTAGIVTQAQIETPSSPPSSSLQLVDKDSASTAAVCLFVFAVVMLFIVL